MPANKEIGGSASEYKLQKNPPNENSTWKAEN